MKFRTNPFFNKASDGPQGGGGLPSTGDMHQAAFLQQGLPDGEGGSRSLASEGLMAGLKQFQTGDDKPEPVKAPKARPVKEETKEEEKPAPVELTQEKQEPSEQEDEGEDDFDFPELGEKPKEKPAKKTEEFSDESFDETTARVLKALEEKGHPGDVYKELREELKQFKKGAATNPQQEARIKELETANLELEGLRERVKSYAQENAEVMLKESPDFQSRVIEPLQGMDRVVEQLAKSYSDGEIPEDAIAQDIYKAITETDYAKQRKLFKGLSENMEAWDMTSIQRMAQDYRGIQEVRSAMFKNAQEHVSKFREQLGKSETESKVEHNKAIITAAKDSFEKYAAKIPGFSDETGSLTEAGKAAMARTLASDPASFTPADIGFALFTATSLKHVAAALKKSQAENEQLRASLGSAAPPKGIAPKKKDKAPDPSMGLMDHMKAQVFGR